MQILETATEVEIDLTDIDLSNVEENMSNAGKIFEALIAKIGEYIADAGINIIFALLLLIVGWRLVNLISKKMKQGKLFGRMEPTAKSFIRSFTTIILKVLLVITALAILGVPMTSMVAVLGSCGLAIGLALQESLSNIAGGFILSAFKPFVVGDYIKCGDIEGTIQSINIFHTKIVTPDNKMIVVPNSVVSNGTLVDYNSFPTRRVDIDIGASYRENSDDVKKALLDAADACDKVVAEPEPTAVIISFDDNAVSYQLRMWCKTEDYWDVKFTAAEKVKKIFDERNIEIPYPQIDVHMKDK
ncbi:MAG: mechanosensitive ion channel family protein [Clostridiales bacterium]|nr:mechanosensitive ion channel family protein [Clostridiales bacterium]MCD7827955.1 mechanosensitive ion channel family protein [Clostridiales bacterium]